MQRPLPVRDEVNAPYWDGANAYRLVILRCANCATFIHPPRPTCTRCQAEDLVPTDVSGRGTIYSFCIMRRPGNPGFDDRLPYAGVVVELAEQRGLLAIGNLLECPVEAVRIGMPVEVTYESIADGVTLPQWRPAGVQGGDA